MTKARRELAALIPSQDVVIEVVDARMPEASANPVIAELRGAKPLVKILTRSDLADPDVTAAWLRRLEDSGERVRAFASTTLTAPETRKRFADSIRSLGLASTRDKPVRALIAGIPNVGKSTLLNTLMNRAVAKVGDKPAVTKIQQRVELSNGIVVTDSPGLLWPKIVDEAVAFRLAFAGSIPDTAIDYYTIAVFGCGWLRVRYPELLRARFKLPAIAATAELVLADIGKRRGRLLPGGVIDLHKASEILVHEFRAGSIGRISLEEPGPVAPPPGPIDVEI
jgi:ribosome biogenesis GTPase A